MKKIVILLIIVSLASLGELVYSTVSVATSVSVTKWVTVTDTKPGYTIPPKTVMSSAGYFTQTAAVCPEDENGVPYWAYPCYIATQDVPFYTFVSVPEQTAPPKPYTELSLETSTVGFATPGRGVVVDLLLVVALSLAGIGLLAKPRKGPTLDG
jgi:hypothetical protein